jgi:hypothetical protein
MRISKPSMTVNDAEAPPTRGPEHEALAIFLGRWTATGTSFGLPKNPTDGPRSNAEPWKSTLTASWYSGKFFLIDAKTGRYVARSFENHGFCREYDVARSGRTWILSGDTERARVEFSADARTQTITWEWKPEERWLPLCDRVAVRED